MDLGHERRIRIFNALQASRIGASLADVFAPKAKPGSADSEDAGISVSSRALQEVLTRADREVRPLRLNFYKRVRLASSFKLRLLEIGVPREVVAEVTQRLVLHLSTNEVASLLVDPADPPDPGFARRLLTLGKEHFDQGDYAEAAACYQKIEQLFPRHPDALNNLGAALCKLGRYKEAENLFRRTIEKQPNLPEAHTNLGNILRWMGLTAASETSLRRALELRPKYADARASLGLTLMFAGRLREAGAHLNKALKIAPRHVEALFGLGQIAGMNGRFDEATSLFNRVLDIDPTMPSAWAALVSLRRMTLSDAAWLEGAEKIAASGIAPLAEADLRFAIGKYCDDIGNFDAAFRSYRRGNDLRRAYAEKYLQEQRTRFVDDSIRIYSRDMISSVGNAASDTMMPVFLVGMMRSGTTLVEQIISSHPSARGVGELEFWDDAARQHEDTALRQGLLDEPVRKQLAEAYLRTVTADSGGALRIVDKTTINFDRLGLIHSVFPNARVIYMQRDPIDTCLSCYFQQFSMSLNFAMDLADLAHYYREHRRLLDHWRSVLPRETLLEVPYEELIADQAGWTRKILDHVGLDWDERCLDFQSTKRSVATASFWQVRQKIYTESVERWRNYERFIGPLRGLGDIEAG